MIIGGAIGTATGTVSGTVYENRSGGQRRAPSDPGIAGVLVSNGREVVRTDAGGHYTLPVDDDLLRTLREGLYHTNMPSWAALGERTMRDVAEYIKTFSPRWKEEGPGDPVAYVPEPPDGAESREKGKAVWNAQACFNCHGQGGKGDGTSVPTLFDDWGFHITPFDFTSSPHRKCGNGDKDLYRTFLTGLNGTPMPSFADTVTPEDAWHLVHFLKTLRVENTEQHLFGFSVGK